MLIQVGNYLVNPDAIDYVHATGPSPNDRVTATFRCGQQREFGMNLARFLDIIHASTRRQALK